MQIDTRVKYDASRAGLGAAFEQLSVDRWKTLLLLLYSRTLVKRETALMKYESLVYFVIIKILKLSVRKNTLKLLQVTEHFCQYCENRKP